MTDDEFETQKQRIVQLIDVWTPVLGLQGWRIDFEFIRQYHESSAVMSVESDWRHQEAVICCYLPAVEGLADAYLEECFLHELAHIFLCELRDKKPKYFINHEERIATWLARSWQWVRDAASEEKNENTTGHESEGDGEATLVTPSHDSLRQGY